MDLITKEQQKFWDIMINNYPTKKSCNTCIYCIPINDLNTSIETPFQYNCIEPEYIKIKKANCMTDSNVLSKWKWNGKSK